MPEKRLTCIVCPLGCELQADLQEGEVGQVQGNSCPRGAQYARSELLAPTRTLTTTVPVSGGVYPVVAVKSELPLPKALLFECMAVINQIRLTAPVRTGEIVVENILDSGVNIIATKTIGPVNEQQTWKGK